MTPRMFAEQTQSMSRSEHSIAAVFRRESGETSSVAEEHLPGDVSGFDASGQWSVSKGTRWTIFSDENHLDARVMPAKQGQANAAGGIVEARRAGIRSRSFG